jgi:hypothetical protein
MGGAGGHMRHPHDLNEVDSGKDIIALFRAIPDYLKSKEFEGGETSSLKLDGSNNGLRLVYRNGRYQFAIDRGSKGDMDIQGVTADQLEDRFKSKIVVDPETGEETAKQHGMVASSNLLLNMMNSPLEQNRDEMFSALKKLGFLVETEGRLIPDSSKYISIEYVERNAFDHPTNPKLGRANVIYYPFDFIAFHGVSEFFEMVLKRTGNVVRQGPKPTGEDSGPGKPVPYDREALNKLVELVTPYAPEGFKVFGPVSLKVAAAAGEEGGEGDIEGALDQLSQNIEKALSTNISIRTRADPNEPPLTMTLEEWLKKAKNFNYQPNIKLTNGKKVSPFHKNIHKALIVDGVSVPELVDDPEIGQDHCDLSGNLYDCEKAIYGAIFMEAARILGNTVKESLMPSVEEFGPAVSHEGIVIDAGMPFGKKKTGHAFKITGEFIIDASGGAYATDTGGSLQEDEVEIDVIDDETADPVIDSDVPEGITYAVVPGAYKPPHLGHLKMVEQYAADPKVDKVIVLISSPLRQQRTLPDGTIVNPEHSREVWQLLLNSAGLGPPDVEMRISDQPSSMGATFDFIGPMGPLESGDRIILGASDKPDEKGRPDWHRWLSVKPKDIKPGVELLDIEENAVRAFDRESGGPFRARDMRDLIGAAATDVNAIDELEEFVGEDNVFELLAIFGMGPRMNEGSAMSAGAVDGAPAAGGGPWEDMDVDKENEKERKISKLKTENLDLNIVDDVIRLIMKRGIMQ